MKKNRLYFIVVLLCICTTNFAYAKPKEAFIGDFVYPDEFYRGFIYNRVSHQLNEQKSFEVVIGKDGWLYQGNMIYRRGPFSDAELMQKQTFFGKIRKYCDSQGIRAVLFIVPTPPIIYPEYLPRYMKINETDPMEQLVIYLNKNEIMDVIYPTEIFIREKSNYKLYYKTDAHWTGVGAFLGTRPLFEHISRWFSAIRLHKIDDYAIAYKRGFGSSLSKALNIENIFIDDHVVLTPKSAFEKLSPLPSAIVIHDSYFNAAEKFIREGFNIVGKKNYREIMDDNGEKTADRIIEQIKASKPDVVIFFVCERNKLLYGFSRGGP